MDRDKLTGPDEPGQPTDDRTTDQHPQWPQKPPQAGRASISVNAKANANTPRQDSPPDVDTAAPGPEPRPDHTAPYRTILRNTEISEEPPIARTAPYKAIRPVKISRKKSNLPLILGILALVLLVAAAVAAYWAWTNLLNKPSVPVSRLLPADTLAYLTIDPSPDEDQRAAFDKLRSTFESDPTFKEAWANLVKSANDLTREVSRRTQGDCKNMLSLDQVSAYLGSSVTLAVLPPSEADLDRLEASSPLTLSAVLDIASHNSVALVDLDLNPLNKEALPAKGPIADLRKQADDIRNAELAETYRNVEIRKLNTCDATLYFSLLSGTSTAVISGKPELLRTIIDTYKGEVTLGKEIWYRYLLGRMPPQRAGTLYLNLSQLYVRAQHVVPDLAGNASAPVVSGAWMFGLTAEKDRMRIDLAAQANIGGLDAVTGRNLDPAGIAGTAGMQLAHPGASPDVNTLYMVPNNSLAFLVGNDIRPSLQEVLYAQRKQNYDSTVSLEYNLRDETGLDLQREILPMIGGDYMISVAPYDPQETSFPPTVFQFRLNRDQRAKVVDMLPKVMKAVGEDTEPQKLRLAGGVFYKRLGSLRIFAGVVRDWLIVVVDSAAVPGRDRMAQVANDMGRGFGGTEQWKQLSHDLPSNSNVIGYVDMVAGLDMFQRNLPAAQKSHYEKNIIPLLRPFKSVLVGSVTMPFMDAGMRRNHMVIFLNLEE